MATTVTNHTISREEYKNHFQKAISYKQYKQQMAEDLALNSDSKIKEYIDLNQRRMHRVEKTFTASADLTAQIRNLKHKTYWLILTEHWCGDASQTLPVFNALAELSEGKIEMKMVYRDQNDELMNAHLTNGSRSIPKLIQMDEHFNVTGIWGPRPAVLQKLVKVLQSDPAIAATYTNESQLWYARDRQKTLQDEIAKLMFRANLVCPDCLS